MPEKDDSEDDTSFDEFSELFDKEYEKLKEEYPGIDSEVTQSNFEKDLFTELGEGIDRQRSELEPLIKDARSTVQVIGLILALSSAFFDLRAENLPDIVLLFLSFSIVLLIISILLSLLIYVFLRWRTRPVSTSPDSFMNAFLPMESGFFLGMYTFLLENRIEEYSRNQSVLQKQSWYLTAMFIVQATFSLSVIIVLSSILFVFAS